MSNVMIFCRFCCHDFSLSFLLSPKCRESVVSVVSRNDNDDCSTKVNGESDADVDVGRVTNCSQEDVACTT